ncbi:hypothetical protein N657DRAFT_650372 [Parathielavia appendiculata]|uniref:Uncharacterized protein n=1 Tax=Parathielavia appendiculata TaxID=2587402 RepID=A0AAN6Z0A1_9PEZI|nr:hypothetical protein N657DRAFT_650372 [Parathielavia appendiculata]
MESHVAGERDSAGGEIGEDIYRPERRPVDHLQPDKLVPRHHHRQNRRRRNRRRRNKRRYSMNQMLRTRVTGLVSWAQKSQRQWKS